MQGREAMENAAELMYQAFCGLIEEILNEDLSEEEIGIWSDFFLENTPRILGDLDREASPEIIWDVKLTFSEVLLEKEMIGQWILIFNKKHGLDSRDYDRAFIQEVKKGVVENLKSEFDSFYGEGADGDEIEKMRKLGCNEEVIELFRNKRLTLRELVEIQPLCLIK